MSRRAEEEERLRLDAFDIDDEAGEHHEISPSGLYQLLGPDGPRCPGAINAQRGRSNIETEASIDGTRTHLLSSTVLEDWWFRGEDPNADRMLGKEFLGMPADEDRCLRAQTYINYVVENTDAKNDILLVEQRLDLGSVLPGWFGTGDAVIIRPAEKELIIVDLKDGRIDVEVKQNAQAQGYGLGGLDIAELLDIEIDIVRLVIVQPKSGGVKEWWISVDNLFAWRDMRLLPALDAAQDPNAPRKPGAKQCAYCRAATDCRELAEASLQIAFANIEPLRAMQLADGQPALRDLGPVSDAELGALFPYIQMVEAWTTHYRNMTTALAHADDAPEGTKLVAGRHGARRWANSDYVEQLLKKKRVKHDLIYSKKLNSPTQLMRLKNKLPKSMVEVLEGQIERPPGRPVLVVASDKRPAINNAASAEDFADDLDD